MGDTRDNWPPVDELELDIRRMKQELEALRELAAAVLDGGPSSKREAAALGVWRKVVTS